MTALLAKLWAWAGKWIALAVAAIAAVLTAAFYGFERGKHTQSADDAAAQAKATVQAAQAAQQTVTDAAAAAAKVQQQAQAQPAPDVEKRNDFTNTTL